MTTRYRRLGINNEPAMGRGRQDFLLDIDAVGQAVITRLKLWQNEWWEDLYLGIPMWQSMLGVVGTKKEVIDRIIQDCIMQTTGISGISYLSSIFNSSDRSYQFYCILDTIYGQTVITNNQGEITR
jgi:hypothetical protein